MTDDIKICPVCQIDPIDKTRSRTINGIAVTTTCGKTCSAILNSTGQSGRNIKAARKRWLKFNGLNKAYDMFLSAPVTGSMK